MSKALLNLEDILYFFDLRLLDVTGEPGYANRKTAYAVVDEDNNILCVYATRIGVKKWLVRKIKTPNHRYTNSE